jgi:cobalt-zinc-cadmium efflux system membrane fusion protein
MKQICKMRWLAFLAGVVLAGCDRGNIIAPPESPAPVVDITNASVTFAANAPQLALIGVEVAQPRTFAVTHVTGRLIWDEDVTARVFTPVSGRVIATKADIGQPVSVGTTFAEIDSPNFGQALAAARTAVGNFTAADKTLARVHDLLAHGSAASKDVEAADAAYQAAKAEQDRALAQLANYGGNISRTNSLYLLRAPLAGVVVEKNINPGQELRPDMMLGNMPQIFNPLFVISQPARLWLQLDVSETDLAALQTGLRLRVVCNAFPGKVFDGTLENIANTMDPATATVKVRGQVSNPDDLLKAGMYVLVDIVQDERHVAGAGVDVPARALFLRDNDYYVFIEPSPGHFQRQKVKVGVERDGKSAVFTGVTAGQKVVSEGALLLQALVEPSA